MKTNDDGQPDAEAESEAARTYSWFRFFTRVDRGAEYA